MRLIPNLTRQLLSLNTPKPIFDYTPKGCQNLTSSGVMIDSDCVTVSEVYWTRFLFVPREGVGVRDPDCETLMRNRSSSPSSNLRYAAIDEREEEKMFG